MTTDGRFELVEVIFTDDDGDEFSARCWARTAGDLDVLDEAIAQMRFNLESRVIRPTGALHFKRIVPWK